MWKSRRGASRFPRIVRSRTPRGDGTTSGRARPDAVRARNNFCGSPRSAVGPIRVKSTRGESVPDDNRAPASSGEPWPTATRSRCSGWACGRSPKAPSVSRPSRGRLKPDTGTSTPPRPMATRRASGERCGPAASRATRCSSPPSSTPSAATRRRRSRRAWIGSASTPSTSTSSTGPKRGRRGPGPAWRPPATPATPARSASRTSASPSRAAAHRRRHAPGGQPDPVQPLRAPPRAA